MFYLINCMTSCEKAVLMMSSIVGFFPFSAVAAIPSPPSRNEITAPSNPEIMYVPGFSIVEGKSDVALLAQYHHIILKSLTYSSGNTVRSFSMAVS